MVGVKPSKLDARIRPLLPGYMTMGQNGGDMGEMGMPVPKTAFRWGGAPGPFEYIGMGGMFTILKVRDDLKGSDDPGWYKHPAGTVADRASSAELKRDGIAVDCAARQPPDVHWVAMQSPWQQSAARDSNRPGRRNLRRSSRHPRLPPHPPPRHPFPPCRTCRTCPR